jgi:type II secretory pathway component PulF
MSDPATPAEVVELPQQLSRGEAEQLLLVVASLAHAKSDLVAGLRARAADCDTPRLKQALQQAADELEQGRSVETVLGPRLRAAQLAGLIAAAATGGNLATVLSDMIELRERQAEQWRQLRGAIAYPLVLLAATIVLFFALANLYGSAIKSIVPSTDSPWEPSVAALEWFVDEGQWLVGGWLAAMVMLTLGLRFAAPTAVWSRVVAAVPGFGKVVLWSGLTEILSLVRLFVAQGVPLPTAWRLAGEAASNAHLAQTAQRIAKACGEGRSLATAWRDEPGAFPPSLAALVDQGERTGRLAESLQAVVQLLEQRLTHRLQLLRTVTPLLLFYLIAALALAVPIGSMVQVLFPVIQGLSGGWRRGGPVPPPRWPEFASWLMFVPLALSLTLGVRLLYADRPRSERSALELFLLQVARVCWVLTVAAIALTSSFMLSPLLLAVATYTEISIFVARYAEEREAFLYSLAMALQGKGNLPLIEVALARAADANDIVGRKAKRFAERLAEGVTISTALNAARFYLWPERQATIATAELTGSFPAALLHHLDAIRDAGKAGITARSKIAYLCWAAFVLVNVLTFLMLNIVPVFAKMFHEFDLPLPGPTVQLVNASNFAARVAPIVFLPVATFGLFALTLSSSLGFRVWARLIPPVHMLRWPVYRDGVLESLALLMEKRWPLPQAFAAIAEVHPVKFVSRRLVLASERTQQGSSWLEALEHMCFVTRHDAALLAAAERNGHLAWALEQVAGNHCRRRAYRLQYAMGWAWPLLILLLGAIVAFVVIGLFLPLVTMMEGLA